MSKQRIFYRWPSRDGRFRHQAAAEQRGDVELVLRTRDED